MACEVQARDADDFPRWRRIQFSEFAQQGGLADVVEALCEVVEGEPRFLDGHQRGFCAACGVPFDGIDCQPLFLHPMTSGLGSAHHIACPAATKETTMTMFDFLAATGAMAWLFIAWRIYYFVLHALSRLRWALWGYRKRHKRAT